MDAPFMPVMTFLYIQLDWGIQFAYFHSSENRNDILKSIPEREMETNFQNR